MEGTVYLRVKIFLRRSATPSPGRPIGIRGASIARCGAVSAAAGARGGSHDALIQLLGDKSGIVSARRCTPVADGAGAPKHDPAHPERRAELAIVRMQSAKMADGRGIGL